jgi:hypothetical protein
LTPGSSDPAVPGAISTRSGRMNNIPRPATQLLLRGARNSWPEGSRSRGALAGLGHHRAFNQVRFAEEAADKRIGRTLIHLDRRSNLIDPAVIHDGDAVGHAHRLLLVVRDVQYGHAEALLDFFDLDLHLEAQVLVKRTERLVHQYNGRVEDDRARQGDALLLPARELARGAIGEAVEPHQFERPGHPRSDRVSG